MLHTLRRSVPALGAALAVSLAGGGATVAIAGGSSGQRLTGTTCDATWTNGHYSSWDEQWLMMSIEGDRFEIAGGQLAQQRGVTRHARDLGARLVKDHSESLASAVKLANDLGIDVPDEPSPSQQWELRAVAQFQGLDFDRWYADLEVNDHMQDIQEATEESEKGCNPRVRDEAQDEIPVLHQHLQLSQATLAYVKQRQGH